MKNRRSWCLATLGREEAGGLSELTWLGTEDKPGLRRTLSSELSIKKDKMMSKAVQILNHTLRQDSTRSPRHWGWTLWEGRVTVGEGGQVFKHSSPSQRSIFFWQKQLGVEQSGGQWVQCSARIFQKHLESARLGQQCLQQNDNIWLMQIYVSTQQLMYCMENMSEVYEAWSAMLTTE